VYGALFYQAVYTQTTSVSFWIVTGIVAVIIVSAVRNEVNEKMENKVQMIRSEK